MASNRGLGSSHESPALAGKVLTDATVRSRRAPPFRIMGVHMSLRNRIQTQDLDRFFGAISGLPRYLQASMAEREEHWADATGQLDHRLYMASKTRKLDHAQGECEAARGTWFRGCYIWFNGYMEVRGARGGVLRPTELQALVRAGGGLVENVDVPRVTHIVAATLPPRKVQELMSRKVGFSKPVVTPSWVVDCDAAVDRQISIRAVKSLLTGTHTLRSWTSTASSKCSNMSSQLRKGRCGEG